MIVWQINNSSTVLSNTLNFAIVKSITWKCPSNIALVKYWGKKEGLQLPANPSLSFTLNQCHTVTTLSFSEKEDDNTLLVSFAFDGKRMPSFEPKLEKFFKNAESMFPFLTRYLIEINSTNTFPHSSGIASSASGMAALALCLCSMEQEISGSVSGGDFYEKASNVARIGSGSACRSVYGPLTLWGETEHFAGSSDLHSVKIDLFHPVFKNYRDAILIVESGEKEVSSTAGHALLKDHPFSMARYDEANNNLKKLLKVLQNGDLKAFTDIVENEALMLHALMMTGETPYILMHPNSLAIIKHVWKGRKENGLHLTITLDAGANVHLLYPEEEEDKAVEFIRNELLQYCLNGQVIYDKTGEGPLQL
ncbi:MAG: diphosphomevalonate decarboxylase [Flavobacteriales bacterium]|nr:diphosphomevalonate decarboxylase [Flavobacteriales bacterium]